MSNYYHIKNLMIFSCDTNNKRFFCSAVCWFKNLLIYFTNFCFCQFFWC